MRFDSGFTNQRIKIKPNSNLCNGRHWWDFNLDSPTIHCFDGVLLYVVGNFYSDCH